MTIITRRESGCTTHIYAEAYDAKPQAFAVVAVLEAFDNGHTTWAAYAAGLGLGNIFDKLVIDAIARQGHKLTVEQATAFFPPLNAAEYRP